MRVGVLTLSDRAAVGEREDLSGPAVRQRVEQEGWQVVRTRVLPDNQPEIEATLTEWADSGELDLILTTGGTGMAPRDRTPEATLAVADRIAPGLAEAMRAASLHVTPHAMLSRSVAAMRGQVLIVNLPGSPKGAIENLSVILPALSHAVRLLRDDTDSDSGHHPPRKSVKA